MMMLGRTWDSGSSYRYGFNGQEKVDEISGSGNHYTAMFWEMDPRLGRRWNRDPKPNPSISEYAVFKNNPIFFTDVLGDTVKGDLKSYNQVKSYVNNQISGFNKQIGNTNTKIADRTAAGKNTGRLESKLARLESSKSAYQGILDEYTALENSTQVYNIVSGASVPAGAGGETRFNSATGYVDVVVGGQLSLLEALPHELKHAYQFETGKISLGYSGGSGSLYDLQDEVEAYQRSQMFGFYPGANITGSWVTTNKGYGTLGKTQLTMSTPEMSGATVTYGDQIKASIYSKGKAGKPPFQVIKDWQIWYNQGTSGQPFIK
ncbi:MAG: hypothetical protein H6546_00770 [Chitinophagales bacterium]|nr:hypothetical protein [Chitinophagales bacterium]